MSLYDGNLQREKICCYTCKFKYLYNNNIVSDTENVSVMVLSTATTAVVSRNIREEFAWIFSDQYLLRTFDEFPTKCYVLHTRVCSVRVYGTIGIYIYFVVSDFFTHKLLKRYIINIIIWCESYIIIIILPT